MSTVGTVQRWAVAVCVLATACGARTGIEIEESAHSPQDSGFKPDVETEHDGVRDSGAILLDMSNGPADTATSDVREAALFADARPDADAASPKEAGRDVLQPPPTCDPGADFIYALSSPGALYRFDPVSRTSALIGPIDCFNDVQSMAVDRQGIAWIEDNAGFIRTVDTRNAHCLDVVLQLAPAFIPSGMAFMSDGPGSSTETLYLGGAMALGAVDPRRIAVRTVGTWNIGPAELTGSPDGRLFALFARANPEHIDELDKTTGDVRSTFTVGTGFGNPILPNVGYGFAYWRNGFWLFGGALAFRYELSSSTLTDTVSTPFSAAGAGVSTCDAPVDASATARSGAPE